MPIQVPSVQVTPIKFSYGDGKGFRFVPPWQINTTDSRQPMSQTQTSYNWTGDGGRGKSLAILAPKATGLEENQNYLPALVQGEFVSNFSGYSAISILDRQRLDEVYAEQLSGYYNDDAGLDLGHLKETDYIMTGNITRTSTGYALQIQITKTADKMTAASYSGTFTFAELDNLIGVRRASMDLIQKMGVTLTSKAQIELSAGAVENHVNAQTALAQGITAQRQGTEVAALSYYFQAAAYDPALLEAVKRSSILNANISSGNIGDNIRNDIQWRKDWIARLTETEQYFDSFNKKESMPYTLFYTTEIKQIGQINYQNETATMGGIETHLHGSSIWTISIERALQAVYDGLEATKRKDVWQLAGWPQRGVTNLNAFARRSQNYAIVFELLNSQGKVIGRQTLQTGGSWALNGSGRPVISINADDRKTVNFQNINANDITERMTIRVATVNGTDAETAARNGVLQIRTSTKSEFEVNDRFKFSKGEIQGFAGNRVADLIIPSTIWGDPVISIGDGAFYNTGLTSITIGANVSMSSKSFGGNSFQGFPDSYNKNGRKAGNYTQSEFLFNNGEIQGFVKDSRRDLLIIPDTIWGIPVTRIGNEAFKSKGLTSVIIPNGVISIGKEAFAYNEISIVTIPNSVTYIDTAAFKQTHYTSEQQKGKMIRKIIIGANVNLTGNPFGNSYNYYTYYDGKSYHNEGTDNSFREFYDKNGKKSGSYICADFDSKKGPVWTYGETENISTSNANKLIKQKNNNSILLAVGLGLLGIGGLVVYSLLVFN